MIEARGVTKVYGAGRRARTALVDVGFRAGPGEIIGVIGPNGAGKTTLFRLIAGDIPVSSGSLTVDGLRAGTRAARRGVGYATDPPVAPPELTGAEWLLYLASHVASAAAEREHLLRWAVDLGELAPFAGRRIVQYSRGMMQRLALAAAAVTGRRVVLLDETLSGVDPLVQRRVRLQIAGLASSGRVVFVASHDLGAVERVATRALILAGGRLRADVSMAVLLKERVAEVALHAAALAAVERVLNRLPGAERTGQGIAVPLRAGLTMEQVIAACRDEHLAVSSSRVRYRQLEDLLVETTHAAAASP